MHKSRSATRSALVIAVVYAVIGGLWILLSDQAVEAAFSSPEAIIRVSMLKGWFYVGATSLLLFWLIRHYMARLQSAFEREVAQLAEAQRSNVLLTNIIDNTDDAIYAKDLGGRYLLLNAAVGRIMGKPVADLLGKTAAELFTPDLAAALNQQDAQVLARGAPQTIQHALDPAQGSRMFLSTKGPLRDRNGRTFGTFGVARDITDALRTENALKESADRLRLLIQYAPVALAMFDRNMCYLVASERWLKDFGLSGRDIVGHSHYAVFPEIGEDIKAIHQRGLAGESLSADEDRFVRTDGTVQWLRWAMRPWNATDGTVGGIVIFTENISERKAAEEALQKLADDLEATVQAIPDLLFEMDAEGRYHSVKATRESLLVRPPEQLLGRTVAEMLPPEAAQTVMDALAAANRTGTDYGRTIMLPLAQGRHHFEISVARKPEVAGQSRRFVVLSRDISARQATEEQLRQRNEELERFHRATVDREIDMLEMKKTINALSRELGRAPPFALTFLAQGDTAGGAP